MMTTNDDLIRRNTAATEENNRLIQLFIGSVDNFIAASERLLANITPPEIYAEQCRVVRANTDALKQQSEVFVKNTEELRRQNDQRSEGDDWKNQGDN